MLGTSRIAALPLYAGDDQFLPLGDRMVDQVGAVAHRIRVVDLRQKARETMLALNDLGRVLAFQIHRLIGRDALTRDLLALVFALGENRQHIAEAGNLLDVDPLQNPARNSDFGLPSLQVGDVDTLRLGDETRNGGRGVEVLHRDLEPEVLGRLVADCLHHGVGDTDMAQRDVLDVLRPDGREAGDRAGSDGSPGRCSRCPK